MSSAVLMEPILKEVFAKSVTSDVLPVSDQPPTVFLALPIKFFTKEDAGLSVPPFLSRRSDKMLLVLTPVLMASTKFR